MTHAEAASNRDGRWMHENYGPVIWGGTGERWDLLQLEQKVPTMVVSSCGSALRRCCLKQFRHHWKAIG